MKKIKVENAPILVKTQPDSDVDEDSLKSRKMKVNKHQPTSTIVYFCLTKHVTGFRQKKRRRRKIIHIKIWKRRQRKLRKSLTTDASVMSAVF